MVKVAGVTKLTAVKLAGDIAGPIDPQVLAIKDQVRSGTLVFDLKDLGLMNSLGARHWAAFLSELSVPFEFHNCPASFIDFANILRQVLGKGKVVSCYAPLVCAKCNRSDTVLLGLDVLPTATDFGTHTCKSCCGAMQPEVEPSDFLAFLSLQG